MLKLLALIAVAKSGNTAPVRSKPRAGCAPH